jgi:hypothetical protein
MPNPFTQVADAVRLALETRWDALGDNDPAKVKINNRWGRNARKDARQVADFPAVDIRPVDGRSLNFSASSSTGLFQKAYELGIATDGTPQDENPDVLDAVEWELIRVAAQAAKDKLGLPTLVLKVEIESSRQTPDDEQQNRGRRRWSGVIVLVVTIQVPRADILIS